MPPLKPFSLTYVVYPSDEFLGPIWALLSLAPPFCVVSLTTTILIGRDLRSAFVLTGLMVTSVLCTILKKLLDHPRPDHVFGSDVQSGEDDDISSGYVPTSQQEGMPSNHASFVAFAAIFSALFAIRRCDRMRGPAWVKLIKRWLPPVVACLIAVGCSYSRVYLGYHTPNQVYAGIGLGCALGSIWYYLYETIYITHLAPYFERLLSSFDFCSPHELDDVVANARRKLEPSARTTRKRYDE